MDELHILSVALFSSFFPKYCTARLSIDQVHRTNVGDFVIVVIVQVTQLFSRLVGQVGGRGVQVAGLLTKLVGEMGEFL